MTSFYPILCIVFYSLTPLCFPLRILLFCLFYSLFLNEQCFGLLANLACPFFFIKNCNASGISSLQALILFVDSFPLLYLVGFLLRSIHSRYPDLVGFLFCFILSLSNLVGFFFRFILSLLGSFGWIWFGSPFCRFLFHSICRNLVILGFLFRSRFFSRLIHSFCRVLVEFLSWAIHSFCRILVEFFSRAIHFLFLGFLIGGSSLG